VKAYFATHIRDLAHVGITPSQVTSTASVSFFLFEEVAVAPQRALVTVS
jgi:hypothetical protein